MNLVKMEKVVTGCCGIAYLSGLTGCAEGTFQVSVKKGDYWTYDTVGIDHHIMSLFGRDPAGDFLAGIKKYAAVHWSDTSYQSKPFANGEALKDYFINKGFKVDTQEVGENNQPGHSGHKLRLYTLYINTKKDADPRAVSFLRQMTYEEEKKPSIRNRVRILRGASGPGIRAPRTIGPKSRVVRRLARRP